MTKPRVLVADDDDGLRQLLRFILVDDFEVVTAGDGAEALEALHAEPFDAAVLDVMMPRMSGLQVTAAVRDDEHLRRLPIILLTALDSDADQARGWDAGCDAYLTKPFEPELLAATLELMVRVEAVPVPDASPAPQPENA